MGHQRRGRRERQRQYVVGTTLYRPRQFRAERDRQRHRAAVAAGPGVSIGPDAYAWTGCNGRAVALSVPLGAELARAVQGCPDDVLALPFTAPAPLMAHGLLRRLAPLR